MKRLVLSAAISCVVLGAFAACTRERPPPRMCETAPPPPEKKEIRVGTCPIEWGSDAGADAIDAPPDAHPDG